MIIFSHKEKTMEKQVFDFKRGKSININYQFITDQKDDYFNKKSQNCY